MADNPTPQPIQKLITGQKVKDTVQQSQSTQSSILSTVQSYVGKLGGLASGIGNMMSNAENIISSTISGFTGKLQDTINNFSSTVNNGITTSLPDLQKKSGSMISQLGGNTSSGAVAKKLAYVVDVTNPSVTATSLFGQGTNINSLLSGISSSALSKMQAASGLSAVANNSQLNTAITTIASGYHSATVNAGSLVDYVLGMPNQLINKTANPIDTALANTMAKVTSAVTNMISITGIGDTNSLIQDTYDLYKTGRKVYDEVVVNGTENLVGYASRFNESFTQVQSLIKLASSICSAMNGKLDLLDNFSKNKDFFDLLLSRLANNGMYGAINDLLNCTDTESYVDENTFLNLANKFNDVVKKGDVLTASTLQQNVGNGRLSDVSSQMKTLATKIDDNNPQEVQAYVTLLNNLGIPKEQILGKEYETTNGTMYALSVNDIESYFYSSPNLTTTMLGTRNVADIASKLATVV